jgi:hypothetical protein
MKFWFVYKVSPLNPVRILPRINRFVCMLDRTAVLTPGNINNVSGLSQSFNDGSESSEYISQPQEFIFNRINVKLNIIIFAGH